MTMQSVEISEDKRVKKEGLMNCVRQYLICDVDVHGL